MTGVERDVQVIQAISTTLSVLEMVNELTNIANGSMYRLDLTSEIERLKGALSLLGAHDDERRHEPPRS
jgi:hypothetical protein